MIALLLRHLGGLGIDRDWGRRQRGVVLQALERLRRLRIVFVHALFSEALQQLLSSLLQRLLPARRGRVVGCLPFGEHRPLEAGDVGLDQR